MPSKRDVLAQLSFGQRIAEDEADALAAYFVETDQWRKIISGEVDVVYGPKGSGKSALYSLLRLKRDELTAKGIIPVSGEKVRGTPVFEDLVSDPPASEEQFRALWKLYFLSLLGAAFQILNFQNDAAQKLKAALQEAGLLLVTAEWSLRRMLKAALDYVRRVELSAEVKINPVSGAPEGIGGKLTLREPGVEQQKHGFISADSLLELANKALEAEGKRLWIVLDRLDVAFADSAELERNALRALFRVYRDVQGLSNFSLKILLRDDIWGRITDTGFREASHITRAITITWGPHALLNLVIRRALHNQALQTLYGLEAAKVLSSVSEQEKLFYRMFPQQVDAGARKPTTFDWMLSRTADGSKQTAPRELIHLLSSARDEQLRLLEMGAPDPPGEMLFSPAALKSALPAVSNVRYNQTLCAEHSTLKPLMAKLDGEKSQQTPVTLAKIWETSDQTALANAERLSEIGFFEKRGSKEQPIFWVPFLYRDALHLVQGPAE
jgi:hypothetical protein